MFEKLILLTLIAVLAVKLTKCLVIRLIRNCIDQPTVGKASDHKDAGSAVSYDAYASGESFDHPQLGQTTSTLQSKIKHIFEHDHHLEQAVVTSSAVYQHQQKQNKAFVDALKS